MLFLVGDAVRHVDSTTGMVQAVVIVERRQPMYNLTVAVAHTFFVGDGACGAVIGQSAADKPVASRQRP